MPSECKPGLSGFSGCSWRWGSVRPNQSRYLSGYLVSTYSEAGGPAPPLHLPPLNLWYSPRPQCRPKEVPLPWILGESGCSAMMAMVHSPVVKSNWLCNLRAAATQLCYLSDVTGYGQGLESHLDQIQNWCVYPYPVSHATINVEKEYQRHCMPDLGSREFQLFSTKQQVLSSSLDALSSVAFFLCPRAGNLCPGQWYPSPLQVIALAWCSLHYYLCLSFCFLRDLSVPCYADGTHSILPQDVLCCVSV